MRGESSGLAAAVPSAAEAPANHRSELWVGAWQRGSQSSTMSAGVAQLLRGLRQLPGDATVTARPPAVELKRTNRCARSSMLNQGAGFANFKEEDILLLLHRL